MGRSTTTRRRSLLLSSAQAGKQPVIMPRLLNYVRGAHYYCSRATPETNEARRRVLFPWRTSPGLSVARGAGKAPDRARRTQRNATQRSQDLILRASRSFPVTTPDAGPAIMSRSRACRVGPRRDRDDLVGLPAGSFLHRRRAPRPYAAAAPSRYAPRPVDDPGGTGGDL